MTTGEESVIVDEIIDSVSKNVEGQRRRGVTVEDVVSDVIAEGEMSGESESGGESELDGDRIMSQSSKKRSKKELKAWRLMKKEGLVPIASKVLKATFDQVGGSILSISNPEVLVSKNSDVFAIFGKISMEKDPRLSNLNQITERLKNVMGKEKYNTDSVLDSNQNTRGTIQLQERCQDVQLSPQICPSVDEHLEDAQTPDGEEGVNEKDIMVLLTQFSKLTRADAIKLLKENDNDLVNVIMLLSEDSSGE